MLENLGLFLEWIASGDNPRQRKAISAAVVSIVILGGLVGSAAASTSNRVLGGITVGGIRAEGLSARRLSEKLAPAASAMGSRPIKLVVADRSWLRSPSDLGITIDLKATTERAMRSGRHGLFNWMFHSISTVDEKLGWAARIDQRALDRAVKELARLVKVEAANGNIILEGSQVKVQAPTRGFTLVAGEARRQLIRAALRPEKNDRLDLPVKITSPDIGEKDTAEVEQQAKAILSSPVQFGFRGRLFTVSPEGMAAALRVREVDDPEDPGTDQSLSLQVDPDALREKVVQAAPFVYSAPKNASFSVAGGEVVLIGSSDGSTVDTEPAALQILNLGAVRTPIALAPRVLPAEFTTEMARGLGIGKKISTFTTNFDPQNAPRVANIDRMAEAIDGKVLRPGDSFSLNAATGARTPENGYQEAQVIVDGELVPGIGGGVCQVATTLFNGVYEAGLEILERSNHSLHISKYPIGRDATVSFGQQDLRFRNDTEYGILLKASVSAKAMTVEVYSSPLGRTVETTASEPRNPKAPSTKYVLDPALPAGQEAVSEEGKPGFDITVTRKVMKDGKVIHTDTFVSKYKAWKKVVRKGTGPPAPPPPVTAAPSVSPPPAAVPAPPATAPPPPG